MAILDFLTDASLGGTTFLVGDATLARGADVFTPVGGSCQRIFASVGHSGEG